MKGSVIIRNQLRFKIFIFYAEFYYKILQKKIYICIKETPRVWEFQLKVVRI